MASNLAAEVPPHWMSVVRPFLQRAEEFQNREPLVSYFLRTHVAFECMRKRTKEDKEGTKFLMKLLDTLEAEKQTLGDKLDGVDGRTVLTKIALMLFAKADDEERSGKASMSIVRIFYTAAVLFEATSQFTEDGNMDAMAAEKAKYAKYIATRMKKALDSNQTYVSPNKIEAPLNDAGEDGGSAGPTAVMSTAPPSAYMPKQPSGPLEPMPSMPPAPPPPGFPTSSTSSTSHDKDGPPPYTQTTRPNATHAQQQQQQQQQQPNRSDKDNMYSPPPFPPQMRSAAVPTTQPPQPQPQLQPQTAQPSYRPPSGGATHTPTPDDMIEAQRNAKQAVSALQFYDHHTARKQLIMALNVLDGKK